MITPKELKLKFPLEDIEHKQISNNQKIISNIINGKDARFLVICGPCSIHDPDSAFDYACRLNKLAIELSDRLYIIMRVYLEKPRTTIGWKGLINDPDMDGSLDIERGIKISRCLLLRIIRLGLPIATEILSLHVPQYIGDLFSWASIGARTIESQVHREIASGLSMPIGFKNSTNGNLTHAINAIYAASMSHKFISINQDGQVCLLKTMGNLNGHIILRGGVKPNYYPDDVADCKRKLSQAKLPVSIIVDCSHGNSNKNYLRQLDVVKSVSSQIKFGDCAISGLMLESHIYAGNQSLNVSDMKLHYGISVTDACIDWDCTEKILCQLYIDLQ